MADGKEPATLRARVHRQLDPTTWPKRGLSPTNRLIVALILLAALAAILETEPAVNAPFAGAFAAGELLFGVAFLVEYLARLWSVAERPGPAWQTRLRFVLSPAGLLDLVAILSALMPLAGLNAAAVRLVRLARIAGLARLGRLSTAMANITGAVWLRRHELGLTLALAAGVLVIGATALNWLEGDLQPDQFGSVPRALWWAVVTLTTIGYGDVYPITAAGKVAASLLALCGIGFIALPAGIMAGALTEVMRGRDQR